MNYRNPVFTVDGGIDAEIEHPVHGWIPCTLRSDDPDTAELFKAVAAGDVAPSPAPLLADVKDAKLREINEAFTAVVKPMIKTYPEIERDTWLAQEAEAKAYQAWIDGGRGGDAPATPKLDRILAGRNGEDGTETIEQLVGKVLANAEDFAKALDLMGRRHRGERLIYAAETVEAVRVVTWESLAG